MIAVQPQITTSAIILHWPRTIEMTDDEFFEFCQINGDLRIERTAEGDIIVMPPEGGETGARRSRLTTQAQVWADRDKTGIVFGSSTGFNLPNGATRSPDVAWVRRSRLAALTPEQKQRFLPLCPDFVIELRSPSDSLSDLQDKMQEYLANGAQLGWLIDPLERRVYVYRPNVDVERLENPAQLSGESVLSGFVLELGDIWEPGF
jgi:Uma2 family endonuclease